MSREPKENEAKRARQWMIEERVLKNVIAYNLGRAEIELANMAVNDRKDGGFIDPQPEGLFSGEVDWNNRKKEDEEASRELEEWLPDWEETENIRHVENAAKTFKTDPSGS